MKKRVLVFDLDGTLFKINTFHYFIKYLLVSFVKGFKIALFFKLSLAVLSRLFSTHAKMKYNVLLLLKNRDDIDYNAFVNSITKKKNQISAVNISNFDLTILATAAPSCYANIIAKNEGFDICFGTNFPNGKFNLAFENSKNNKKENVLKYLKSQNINKINTLVTDHIDDLPLMRLASKNLIVSPDKDLLNKLKLNSISFEVIN
ncbi:haloacid dehalogenase-like hydrolase [Litoribaculum gwangyangense]|uniref:Haloacid dehalogenase-like hydrolase n=1 Tax=Litoribaculum gwangyangense TaxID=1130722 RepID=A0ABP9CQ68_9FLAO